MKEEFNEKQKEEENKTFQLIQKLKEQNSEQIKKLEQKKTDIINDHQS